MPAFSSLLPDTADVDASGLTVGGCRLSDLADQHGTPLYVYDEETLRASCRSTRRAFEQMSARVSFAAKACSTIGILRVLHDERLDLDVVSGGELLAGELAGFENSQIHLHGNYKSAAELEMAVIRGLHAIVVDNLHELAQLEEICRRLAATASIMLRITLATEADTHPHIQTSGRRSKFGFQHGSEDETAALLQVQESPSLLFRGLHTHLGSQIADAGIYRRAATELIAFAVTLRSKGMVAREVSVGGGWGVPYRRGDAGLSADDIAAVLAQCFASYPEFQPAVEPGRALVARAGVALYRVGSIKWTGNRRIVAVDGGMGDNPRPALYGARYDALVVSRPDTRSTSPVEVVGRYCESGDILASAVDLPAVRPGDLICVPVSGAYHLSMASTYNRVPSPAVIMVRDGSSTSLVRRASTDELFALEHAGD